MDKSDQMVLDQFRETMGNGAEISMDSDISDLNLDSLDLTHIAMTVEEALAVELTNEQVSRLMSAQKISQFSAVFRE